MDNVNSPEYLNKIKRSVIENIRRTGKPGVQAIHTPRDMDSEGEDEDEDDDNNPDVRETRMQRDRKIEKENEFEDSDNEMEGVNGNGLAPKRSRITDYANPLAVIGPGDEDISMSGANGNANEADDEENGAADDEDEIASEASKTPAQALLASQAATPTLELGEDADGDDMEVDDEAAAAAATTATDTPAPGTQTATPAQQQPSPPSSPPPARQQPAARTVPTVVPTTETAEREDVEMGEDPAPAVAAEGVRRASRVEAKTSAKPPTGVVID
jgi:histone deacetylase 1/2